MAGLHRATYFINIRKNAVPISMESLTRIKVENFKNLKNFEMPLRQFNVLIGPNGAGKTNVLEFVKFVNVCLAPQKTHAQPFKRWGGYKNMVWSHNEHESINLQINYTVDDCNVTYNTAIAGSGNDGFAILEEKLEIDNYLKMELDAGKVCYNFDPSLAGQACSKDMQVQLENRPYALINSKKGFLASRTDTNATILKAAKRFEGVLPKQRIAMLQTATDYLAAGKNIILIRQLNYGLLRQPTPVNYSVKLDEDGDGLVNLLFQWFDKNQELPEIIRLALKAMFPNWQISFKVTPASNIMLEVHDGTNVLPPTCIPDGFYKLLTILAAIELGPKILLIDEIETSLHARILEYVIDSLQNTDMTVIVTTHSPFVVDCVNIKDLTLLECTDHKSTCRKIKDPDKLEKELSANGITVSDSWLYGEL